jgi:hypothetical protein
LAKETSTTNVPTEKILKDLMLGLIYPAVLGSIIYTLFSEIKDQLTTSTFNDILGIKFYLFVITIVFYLCDYLYITYTNNFGWFFFFCDLIFVGCLYTTTILIDIDTNSSLPNPAWISGCYILFLLFYLGWDIYEKGRSSQQEKKLYCHIIIWEVLSVILLISCMVATRFSTNQYYLNKLLAGILTLITVLFVWLTYRKRKFYRQP